jgi:hypothetical protein
VNIRPIALSQDSGHPEPGLRSSRFVSLLVVWFSLFTVAAPAITCAAAMQHHDCCPGERMPPCGECSSQAPAPDASPGHCLSAPAAVAHSGALDEQARKITAPDLVPVFLVSIPPLLSLDAATEPASSDWPPPLASLDSPAYLVTGRLRL